MGFSNWNMGADYNKALKFNNKGQYAAFNKVRTVDDVDYTVNLGCGKPSKGVSSAIELNDRNGIINRLDVCKDGNIYNQNAKYMVYDEHNWGLAFAGMGGRDTNATSNTTYKGYYKFCTLRCLPNADYRRTSAIFLFTSEDVQYKPSLFYVSYRFNQITTSGGINALTNYWLNFGGATTPDVNMTNRIFFAANKPTSNSEGNFVDIYWYQDTGYNTLRYYLIQGSYRTSSRHFDTSYIDLYTPQNPTLTDLSSNYSLVWKATDVLNTSGKIMFTP